MGNPPKKSAVAVAVFVLASYGCTDTTTSDQGSTPGEAINERKADDADPATEASGRDASSVTRAESTLQADVGEVTTLNTTVIDSDGNEAGTLSIEPQQRGVRIALNVEGLSPGPHAVHFHEHGRCDPPEFQSAGDHYNPTRAPHGMPDADGDPEDPDHHVGDMLNQDADDQGNLNTVMINHTATLAPGPTTLLDEDGSALIIHEGPDDYETQPAGDAGGRVACAVITRAEADTG